MEITVKDGDREITIRDKRLIIEPEMLADMLSAVRVHLDGESEETVAILPFGFTRIADQDGDDEDGPEGGPEVP
jgi:hypothetical protein